MKKVFLVASIASLLTTSCATIFTGTKDRITFNSNPQGAVIYKDGVEQCKTPCTLKVRRSMNETDMEFKLDGYETRLITLDKAFNTVSVVNLGNLLGWGVDALTGAVMKYDRKSYDIELSKSSRTSQINPARVDINTETKVVDLYVQSK